eukprot:1175688-Rhodomonas_salina.3
MSGSQVAASLPSAPLCTCTTLLSGCTGAASHLALHCALGVGRQGGRSGPRVRGHECVQGR